LRSEFREGEGPREEETQESQDGGERGNLRAAVPTGSGIKPLKPTFFQSACGSEGRMRASDGSPLHVAAGLKRQEGMARREAGRSLSGQALKGEPRERARLKHTGETVSGARRRGRQELRGRNVTRGRHAPGVCGSCGWVALWGHKPRESEVVGFGRRTEAGSDSEAGCKPVEGTQSVTRLRPRT
jgi:hypothetical protein